MTIRPRAGLTVPWNLGCYCRAHHRHKAFLDAGVITRSPMVQGFGRAYSAGLTPVAATVVAAAHHRLATAHPRAAVAHPRRREVVRTNVGDVALTVDYYLTALASDVGLGDGGGSADHRGYRKTRANRREE